MRRVSGQREQLDVEDTARTKAKVGYGLSAAAVALLDSLRIPTTPPPGWVTAKQMADYLGITKNAAVEKINRMGWKRILIQVDKTPPTYYYGPKQAQAIQTAKPRASNARNRDSQQARSKR